MGDIEEDQMVQILSYSSDKDRLELEMRKLMLIRLIESQEFKIEDEKILITQMS